MSKENKDCKYARLDLVEVKTPKQLEIIKKVLNEDNSNNKTKEKLTDEMFERLQTTARLTKNELMQWCVDEINRLKEENKILGLMKDKWYEKLNKAREENAEFKSKLEEKTKECRDIADDYQEMGRFYYEEVQKNEDLKAENEGLKECIKQMVFFATRRDTINLKTRLYELVEKHNVKLD